MKIVQRRLTAAFVKTQAPGRDCDGGGLYLQVTPTDGGFCRSWLFCYQRKSTVRYASSLVAATRTESILRQSSRQSISPTI
jgi:hypothetical protein